MNYEESDEYFELAHQHANYEISDEEFAEGLMRFKSYPLAGMPNPDAGVTLKVVIQPKMMVSVSDRIH